MTFLEKLKQENPEAIDNHCLGGASGCPFHYGYEKEDDRPCEKDMSFSCVKCWNREMPEPEKQRPEDSVDALTFAAKIFPNFKIRENYTAVKLKEKDDPVNHPAHYTAGGIECIDAIAAALTCQKDPMEAWLTGQVLKYLWRWPLKNGLEDLKKAQFYLNRLIEKVGEQA